MGQTTSTSPSSTQSDVLFRQNNTIDIKDELSYQKKYSKFSQDELIQYIREMEIKPFYHNEKFKELLSSVVLTNEELVPLSIELYEKLRKDIPYVAMTEEDKKESLVSKIKKNIYIKPTFSLDDLKETLKDENLPVEALSAIDFELVNKMDDTQPYDKSHISLSEFNESFRQFSTSKDMIGITKSLLHDLADHQKLYIIAQYNKLMKNAGNVEKLNIGRASYMYKASKKGPANKVKSFRQIVVIPTVVNHLHRMMAIRLNKYLANQKYIDTTIQKGGVMNQSFGLFEQIYKVKKSIKIANKDGRKACVAFLDMSNAFGSLALDRMYEILEKYNVPSELIEYIKRFYATFKYYVEAGDLTYGPVEWKRGLIQGCPLSPLLFCLTLGYALSHVEKSLKSTHGFKFEQDNSDLNILFSAYMDDICIITEDSNKMKDVLDSLLPKLKKLGLCVNPDKSAVMYINHTKDDVVLDNMPEVSSYKYLGEYLSKNGTTDESFSQFIKELSAKLYQIDRRNKLRAQDKADVFFQSILPWMQRKMVAMFDAPAQDKLKVLTMVNTYMTKWNAVKEMKIFTMVNDIFKSSNDEIIKNIDMEEDHKASINVKNDIKLIKATFEENNVNFTYESVNDSEKLDLLLDKLSN